MIMVQFRKVTGGDGDAGGGRGGGLNMGAASGFGRAGSGRSGGTPRRPRRRTPSIRAPGGGRAGTLNPRALAANA